MGGRALEELIGEGLFAGVLDFVTHAKHHLYLLE
jgi:uncharacterized protein (UPF0261 family)